MLSNHFLQYNYCVSVYYPLSCFYLKNTTHRKLDSASIFRWNLLGWAQLTELLRISLSNVQRQGLVQFPRCVITGDWLYGVCIHVKSCFSRAVILAKYFIKIFFQLAPLPCLYLKKAHELLHRPPCKEQAYTCNT
jgi:hypothetical protein